MPKKNPNLFLYQINFNKLKYPEVCNRLETAKDEPGGIAWYLRKLILKDIQETNFSGQPLSFIQQNKSSEPEQPKPIPMIEQKTGLEQEDEQVFEVEVEAESEEEVNKDELRDQLSASGGFEV